MLSSGNFKFRIYLVILFFFIIGALLAGRLFFIQVVEHDFHASRAERQYTNYLSKPDIAIRGSAYFKQKNGDLISAASIKDGFLVAVNPDLVVNAENICSKLEEVDLRRFDFDTEDCLSRCNKKGDPFEVIANRLDVNKVREVQNMDLTGVGVYPEQWRFYPGDSMASQVLGFVGYGGDELVGRYGLESYYEDVLRGKKKSLNEASSFATLFFELGKEFLSDDVYNGHDIVLTIEPRVQSLLENTLKDLINDWSVDSAGGLIMDPKSGAIFAMASKPDFDLNNYSKTEDISYFRNPLVSSIFEMGSVFKPLTLAAAMDAGKIEKDTTYTDKGYVIFNNQRIENYDGKARGLVDMQTVLSKSLNTGAVFAMQKLGKENFKKYITNFGLGEKTGIDLPDEIEGHISNLFTSRDIEYATASFGHGIAVSPIEFSVAVASLANGGRLVKPFVVEKIIVEGGMDYITEPEIRKQVLKEETSEEITRMLVEVVDEALLGGTVKLDHYSVAAKTGTALLPKEGESGYYEDQYFHSFFGYAPAFDAKFLIFLYLKNPQGIKYASHTLSHPFMQLLQFLLNYYEIPPDR